jgi:LuxR family maltose regulon positive regulatory protein
MNRLDEGLAKIARPRNRQIYRRTGLFRKLDDATETPGIWIYGPPGSGKTTLISSYLQEQNRTCLWYQVDNSDLDIATLFWYLRLAVKNISPRSYVQLEPFSSAYRGSLKAFASRYFEKL